MNLHCSPTLARRTTPLMLLLGTAHAADIVTLTPASHGALAVAIAHDAAANQTTLQAHRLDPAGQPLGPPTSLQPIDGQVLDVAVTAGDSEVWVAWVAMLSPGEPDRPAQFTAAVQRIAPAPTEPVSLHTHTLGSHPEHGVIAAAARTGGGVWVAVSDEERPCRFQDLPEAPGCLGYSVYRVEDDQAARLYTGALSGGPELNIEGLVDTPQGPALSAWAWRGGANVDARWLREPPMALPSCRPPMARVRDDGGLWTLCPATFGPEGCTQDADGHCFLVADDIGAHSVSGWELTCSESGPVVTLSWAEQTRSWPLQTLEQGAVFGVGVWAGEAMLSIQDGSVQTAPCLPRTSTTE